MPVLAMGGAESSGAMVAETMKLVADDVQTLIIPGIGHWLAEQAPEELLAALTAFLAPYRDGLTGQGIPGPVPPGARPMGLEALPGGFSPQIFSREG